MASYRLARYQFGECRKMGAASLDPEAVAEISRLLATIQVQVDQENWRAMRKNIPHLAALIDDLNKRMKVWDADGDGLSNYAEYMLYGTSWKNVDSDGDGFLDRTEIFVYETDPLDYCALPLQASPEVTVRKKCQALEAVRARISAATGVEQKR
ncbi:MAG: hypothetical protein JRJ12_01835 [Deltaproteobacteria bacterium]|nr:hypothetical protein [Deltaproteobacteria bacterium]MBW2069892.1 hypothetical protein [Deltaproteobacteria bacterium]